MTPIMRIIVVRLFFVAGFTVVLSNNHRRQHVITKDEATSRYVMLVLLIEMV